jgi:ubiquinone/menaquinone biosynthesis C-methylase UbiE
MKIKRCLLKNLDFYQVDVTQERLPFQDDEFDFVKQRLVTASFTLDNWKSVLQELIRVTKPGGYIELIEIDFSTYNLGPKGSKLETDSKT